MLSSLRLYLTVTDILCVMQSILVSCVYFSLEGLLHSLFSDSRISSQYVCCCHFSICKGWRMSLCYSHVLATTQVLSMLYLTDQHQTLVKVMQVTITEKSKRGLLKGMYHNLNSLNVCPFILGQISGNFCLTQEELPTPYLEISPKIMSITWELDNLVIWKIWILPEELLKLHVK